MEPKSMSELDTLGVLGYLEQHKNKSLLRVLACGSVDDGKSTLIGRLLHDSQQLYDDHLAALRNDQKGVNADGDLELAMLVDGLQALAQPHGVGGLLQVHRLVEEAGGELVPGALVALHLRGQGLGHAAAELLVAPGPAGAAQHREPTGQALAPIHISQPTRPY